VAVNILKEVFRLENKGKMAEAQALRKIIPVGKVIGERAINQAAQDFEQRLFKVGGLGTVEAVLKKVLNRALMRQIHVSFLEMSG